MGDRNPVTPEGEGDEGILPGWDVLKVLLLGDAHNGFNNLSRLVMLWTICHRWHIHAQFPFNWYRHIVQLLVQLPGEVDMESLISKDWVTQGYPLSMVIYELRLYMLVDQLRGEYTRLPQS